MNKKLLATIGPSSLNKEVIQLMELNGVNLLRINLSHTKINDLKNIIESIKLWSSVPICLDSEGAQIRNQDMINESVVFTKGDHVDIYFAHPYSSWERGINENTNGLIRQYFPKGTDFNKVTDSQIEFVMERLNTRPRKTRGGKQPVELFLGKAVDLLTV